jgi:ubiquinone/menaquinone biosynthesis C-methylase UbiE
LFKKINLMNESFEKDEVWETEIYTTGEEGKRFSKSVSYLPEGIKNILDIGCGNGAFLNIMEASKPDVIGYGLEYTASGIKNKICKTEIKQGSIDSIPFDNKSIDIVSALEVIEHLPIPVFKNGLKEMERVASKYILISVPYQENRVNVVCPSCFCEFNPNTHVRSFYDETMANLFDNFKLVKLEKFGQKREMYFGNYRRLAKSIFGKNFFPNHCVCPLCSYSKDIPIEATKSKIQSGPGNNSSQLVNMAKKVFFYNSYRWYLALYERKDV